MNRLYSLLFIALITCPAAQALDIKTDASCKKLVVAIEQGQNLERCKTAWQAFTASKASTAQDQTAMLDQALQLAQEQKVILEKELANLSDETKNHSKIKWGVAQLVLGAWLAIGEVSFLLIASAGKKINHMPTWQFWWPDMWALDKRWIPETPNLIFVVSRLVALNPIIGTYSLYKGYKNLKQGLNYKQFLQDKITNLDAIIIYLQDLQTNNH
jgi:hypothetical protein